MKKVLVVMLVSVMLFMLGGCDSAPISSSRQDTNKTLAIGNTLSENQPTPTDIERSLERYNLIKRTYWVNGRREKALSLPRPLADIPLGYCILLTDSGAIIGSFVVDGKVTSLNSYLTPDSEYYEVAYGGTYTAYNKWLPDVDGAYGFNDNGIFFFTVDGKYVEYNGKYLYSDIPFIVDTPVVTYREVP